MELRLCLLISVSIFVQNFAQPEEKPAVLEINEENQEDFELPLGTQLILDERTQLYKPPNLSNNFTAEDRYQIMWKNPVTHYRYCKEGPGLHRNVFKRMGASYFYYSWCLSNGKDLCCDNKKCTCGGPGGSDCSCLTDEAHVFYEHKKESDKTILKGIFKLAIKIVQKIFEAKNSDQPAVEE